MVSARGGRYGYVAVGRQDVYRALRRHGMSRKQAAQIANASTSHVKRSIMTATGSRGRARRALVDGSAVRMGSVGAG